MSDQDLERHDGAKLVFAVAALGAAGYFGYTEWYLPNKTKKDLQLYAASRGMSTNDLLASIGSAGCQAIAGANGIPPGVSSGVCSSLSSAAAALSRELPSLVGGTLQAVGGGVGVVGQGAATGITAIAKAPINVASYGVSTLYGGGKSVVKDVYGGAKTVVSDVVSAPVKLIKGIASLFG